MKYLLPLLVFIGLSGCAAPAFTPTTAAGAECKKQCAANMQLCSGSSYTCDKGYANCIESCIDAERVLKK